MITKEEVLMGRIKYEDLSKEMQANLDGLVSALNVIRAAYGKPLHVSSGYRSPEQNAAAGGAKLSNHMKCLACDFKDTPDGVFGKWCLANLAVLEKAGLYMEDFATTHSTKGGYWVHLQLCAPKSGKRVFLP